MAYRRKELKIEGANLWYLVGLIASDGCLSGDGRRIDITSKDYGLLETVKAIASLENRITDKYNGRGQKSHRVVFGNRTFYDFLLSIGLTPHKSLTLGALCVPQEFFVDFLRGHIDGDGCIRSWIHPSNKREQWNLRIYSGSEKFIGWLQRAVTTWLRVEGKVYRTAGRCGSQVWTLKYGKMAAREICRQCYYPGCAGLTRKAVLANACRDSAVGWRRSKTIVLSH